MNVRELDFGDNPLHDLVRKGVTVSELKQFIADIGEKVAGQYAKSINRECSLPIQLLDEKNEECYQLLKSLTVVTKFKQFSQQIDFEKLCTKYDLKPESTLFNNMKLAVIAANIARSFIDCSQTDPTITDTQYRDVSIKLKQMRQAFYQARQDLNLDFPREKPAHATWMRLFEGDAALIRSKRVGNCAEMSLLAYYELTRMNVQCAMIDVKKGDHAFVLIGNRMKDDDAVVCDPWSGKVYPANLFEKKMKVYVSFRDAHGRTRTLSPYNSAVSSLAYSESINHSEVCSCQLKVGLFIK